jgi:hypothetical protein
VATKTTLTRDWRKKICDEEKEREEEKKEQARGWKKKAVVELGTRVGPSTWPESSAEPLIGWTVVLQLWD